MNEQALLNLITEDPWMMNVLRHVRSLQLPDAWVAAGFVRNKVWDVLHGYEERTPLRDIDVIFFDQHHMDESYEKELERRLQALTAAPWSVKNQARMHLVHSEAPYTSCADALAHWVETPTCLGVRMEEDDRLTLLAPYGIEDLVHLVVRPSPGCTRDRAHFEERWRSKHWKELWPKLRITP